MFVTMTYCARQHREQVRRPVGEGVAVRRDATLRRDLELPREFLGESEDHRRHPRRPSPILADLCGGGRRLQLRMSAARPSLRRRGGGGRGGFRGSVVEEIITGKLHVALTGLPMAQESHAALEQPFTVLPAREGLFSLGRQLKGRRVKRRTGVPFLETGKFPARNLEVSSVGRVPLAGSRSAFSCRRAARPPDPVGRLFRHSPTCAGRKLAKLRAGPRTAAAYTNSRISCTHHQGRVMRPCASKCVYKGRKATGRKPNEKALALGPGLRCVLRDPGQSERDVVRFGNRHRLQQSFIFRNPPTSLMRPRSSLRRSNPPMT